MGKTIDVSCEDFTLQPELPEWHTLVRLHYLDLADGTPLSGQLVSFGQVKDGMVRSVNFDLSSERDLQTLLAERTKEQIQEMCSALGAEFVPGHGNMSSILLVRCGTAAVTERKAYYAVNWSFLSGLRMAVLSRPEQL